jgi:hypothetical protein
VYEVGYSEEEINAACLELIRAHRDHGSAEAMAETATSILCAV